MLFSKYINRLNYVPGIIDPAAANIPIVRFTAEDQLAPQAFTAGGRLLVSYRYLRNDLVTRDWTVLTYPGESASYSIPIAFQTLSADLASSTEADTHMLEMRACDLAGNETTRTYSFVLRLLFPPVWLQIP